MSVAFTCSECGKSLRAPEDKRGKRIKCSACSSVITIPNDDDEPEDELEPVRRSKNSGKVKRPGSKKKSAGISPLVWVGCAGVAVIGIGLLIWSLLPRGRTGTSGETMTIFNAAAKDADLYQDHKRLRSLAFGMFGYHDNQRQYPVADKPENFGPDGRPFLSWRVHLLPYIGQLDLYKQFHLNEPWDSAHNKPLIEKMPDAFRSGNETGTKTRMLTLTGPNTLFFQRNVSIRDVTDGTSNTIMIAQVGPDKAVPWTKADDVILDPANPLAAFGRIGKSFLCAMADGMAKEIDSTIDSQTLAAIISPKGGEKFDLKKYATEDSNRKQLQRKQNDSIDPRWSKLSDIGLAMYEHHYKYRSFPVADNPAFFDTAGRTLVSWRVHLLPFLGQDELYQQFHLNEPWDSPHNSTLLEKIPEVYRSPSHPGSKTPFLVFTGPNTVYAKPSAAIRDITDGSSNTILLAAVAENKMVPWTQPADIVFDPAEPFAGLGAIPSAGLLTLFSDPSVKLLKPTVDAELFKKMVDPADGQRIDVTAAVLKSEP